MAVELIADNPTATIGSKDLGLEFVGLNTDAAHNNAAHRFAVNDAGPIKLIQVLVRIQVLPVRRSGEKTDAVGAARKRLRRDVFFALLQQTHANQTNRLWQRANESTSGSMQIANSVLDQHCSTPFSSYKSF
ncbi:MAG: hypothetical protein ACYCU8_01075 [Ferrimicrobium acidiphilum]